MSDATTHYVSLTTTEIGLVLRHREEKLRVLLEAMFADPNDEASSKLFSSELYEYRHAAKVLDEDTGADHPVNETSEEKYGQPMADKLGGYTAPRSPL